MLIELFSNRCCLRHITSAWSDIATAFTWIGNFETHVFKDRIYLFHVIRSSQLVGASLEPPIAITLGAFGSTPAEHGECSNVPIVNRFLDSLLLLITFGKQFERFVVAVL